MKDFIRHAAMYVVFCAVCFGIGAFLAHST